MAKKATQGQTKERSVELQTFERGSFTVNIVGTAPLLCNRMSQKVWRELLLPALKKTRTEKATTLKHDPRAEFRASPYTLPDADAPTLIAMPGAAFKRALATAAIDLGARKAEIGRLSYVVEEYVPIFGLPQISLMITRSRDMNRTPDVRTRAILPSWACTITVTYVRPNLKENALLQLLQGAGEFIGVGDGRPEKGALAFGRFRVAGTDDTEWKQIVKLGDRRAQLVAMDEPVAYDRESEDMLAWFDAEARRREFKVA